MLLSGNLYLNTAQLYDLDNRDLIKDDILFYTKYANNIDGDILEMACGTGRISLALLKNCNKKIDAFDLSPTMLEQFQTKLLQESDEDQTRISLHCLDLSDFNLDHKYGLIILPWRSFQYITDDNNAKSCLEQTIKHMDRNSTFIISIFNPQKSYDADWIGKKNTTYQCTNKDKNLQIVLSTTNIAVDSTRQIITYASNFEIKNENTTTILTDTISQKYYYNDQIRRLLNSTGLEIENEFGYYDESAITDLSEQIFICKLK